MNQSLKVFVAVALGSFIGALIALQFRPCFWWLGLLPGGLVGYLSYQPMVAWQAIPKAARITARFYGLASQNLAQHKTQIAWHALGMFSQAFWWYLGMYWLAVATSQKRLSNLDNYVFLPFMALGTAAVIYISAQVFLSNYKPGSKNTDIAWTKIIILKLNPIYLGLMTLRGCWAVLYNLPKAVYRAIRYLPTMAKVLLKVLVKVPAHFLYTLFRLIHSDVRLLCGVDAAIGAAIGYFTASALLGAVVGGLWGVLNYEIISKKIFKLVSAKS